jgi:hypothetical protein
MDFDASVREAGWSMAKENPSTKPKAMTPFPKFEQLAKRLMRVPRVRIPKDEKPGAGS